MGWDAIRPRPLWPNGFRGPAPTTRSGGSLAELSSRGWAKGGPRPLWSMGMGERLCGPGWRRCVAWIAPERLWVAGRLLLGVDFFAGVSIFREPAVDRVRVSCAADAGIQADLKQVGADNLEFLLPRTSAKPTIGFPRTTSRKTRWAWSPTAHRRPISGCICSSVLQHRDFEFIGTGRTPAAARRGV